MLTGQPGQEAPVGAEHVKLAVGERQDDLRAAVVREVGDGRTREDYGRRRRQGRP